MCKKIQRFAKLLLIVKMSKFNLTGQFLPSKVYVFRKCTFRNLPRNRNKGARRILSYCFRGTHDHCDAHGRVVPRRNVVGALGVVAVARLCLTLPRTTPRLRVLILISPLKFLWQQHAGQLSIGQDCVPRSTCST